MWAVPYAALLVFAGGLDVYGTVVAETRAGEMPLQAGQESRPFVAGLIIPMGVLELRQPDLEMELGYGPRLYWQDPTNQGGSSGRPLILHLAHFDARARPSARVTVGLHLLGSEGEVDYSLLPQVFGTAQGTLPAALKILTGTGAADVALRASRLWLLALGARIEYREPLQDADMTMPAANALLAFPRQTLVSTEPYAQLRLSRRDDLTFACALLYGNYSGGVEVVTVTPKVTWRTRTGPHSQLDLAIGVTSARDLGPVSAVDTPISPVGGVLFDGAGLRLNGMPVHVTTAVVVDYFVDPILRVAGPRGSVSGRVLAGLRTTWTIGAEAALATSLRTTALPGQPDETAIFVSIPVRHPLSPHLLAEFGGRLTERAPSFAAQQFALHQQQIWLYLMLAATSRGSRVSASP